MPPSGKSSSTKKYRFIGPHAIELEADSEGRVQQVGYGDFFEVAEITEQVQELIASGQAFEVKDGDTGASSR